MPLSAEWTLMTLQLTQGTGKSLHQPCGFVLIIAHRRMSRARPCSPGFPADRHGFRLETASQSVCPLRAAKFLRKPPARRDRARDCAGGGCLYDSSIRRSSLPRCACEVRPGSAWLSDCKDQRSASAPRRPASDPARPDYLSLAVCSLVKVGGRPPRRASVSSAIPAAL